MLNSKFEVILQMALLLLIQQDSVKIRWDLNNTLRYDTIRNKSVIVVCDVIMYCNYFSVSLMLFCSSSLSIARPGVRLRVFESVERKQSNTCIQIGVEIYSTTDAFLKRSYQGVVIFSTGQYCNRVPARSTLRGLKFDMENLWGLKKCSWHWPCSWHHLMLENRYRDFKHLIRYLNPYFDKPYVGYPIIQSALARAPNLF